MAAILRMFACLIGFTGAAFATELGDDGLHKQPWFLDSFLEMADDLAEAFRLPGYLKPFHYISSLEFVASEAYKTLLRPCIFNASCKRGSACWRSKASRRMSGDARKHPIFTRGHMKIIEWSDNGP